MFLLKSFIPMQLDRKTVSSFAGRSKIQARSLGRGNGRGDGSEKEWDEGLKQDTVDFTYFKSVLASLTFLQWKMSHYFHVGRTCFTTAVCLNINNDGCEFRRALLLLSSKMTISCVFFSQNQNICAVEIEIFFKSEGFLNFDCQNVNLLLLTL